MARWQAEIIGTGILKRATVEFEAENETDAAEQAYAYADRIDPYSATEVDSLTEMAGA